MIEPRTTMIHTTNKELFDRLVLEYLGDRVIKSVYDHCYLIEEEDQKSCTSISSDIQTRKIDQKTLDLLQRLLIIHPMTTKSFIVHFEDEVRAKFFLVGGEWCCIIED